MSQIINWLRKSSNDFAYVVLDFGTPYETFEEDFPNNPDKLDEWLNSYATGSSYLVPLTEEVTVSQLKEVIKRRFEVNSAQHGPYEWKSLRSRIDVLIDEDDDGRAVIFHTTKNTPFAPNMENTCRNLGNDYWGAYNSLQKK